MSGPSSRPGNGKPPQSVHENVSLLMNTNLYTLIFEKKNESFLGVAHGSDIPFAFDTVPTDSTATTAQTQLRHAISASWSAFANSGNVTFGSVALKGWTESWQKKGG